VVGTMCASRQRLGTGYVQKWRGANAAERKQLMQEETRQSEEETRKVKSVEMGSQGAWTRLETEERKLTWSEIWMYRPWQLQFILRASCV